MRSGIRSWGLLIAVAALLSVAVHGYQADASVKKGGAAARRPIEKTGGVQLVTFPDTGWSSVRVVRGSVSARNKAAEKPETEKAETAEIVTFGDPQHSAVRVMRGETARAAMLTRQPHQANGMKVELVSFADPRERPVSILRGIAMHLPEIDLFRPASVADLDRVAFAVDGAESAHGLDLRMWRPEPSGPQGPMQVTAAAAVDVGGGDRFDLVENRTLGRAYLARMYRRYGNWADAIAAYNWGPGNLDTWIAGGRAVERFPLEVERYRDRVLRDATLTEASAFGSRD